jgi:transposase
VTEEQTTIKTQALLAVISNENGVDHFAIYDRSVKNDDFSSFLVQLRSRFPDDPIALFMDNLSVHHSKMSRKAYDELNIIPLFNSAHSPQFNPIESVFSMIKSTYRKLLLKNLIEKKKIRPRQLISEETSTLDLEKIRNCIRHAISEIDD